MLNKILTTLNTLILNIISILNLPQSKRPVVLCYHSISNDNWEFSRRKKDFIEDLDALIKTKKFIDLKTFKAKYRDKFEELENTAVLTFDDGYADFANEAFGILKDKGIPVTLFVIGEADKADRTVLKNDKELLSIETIKKLIQNGVTVGQHTNKHRVLKYLDNNEVVQEIDKYHIEDLLSTSIDTFAYPMGIKFDNYAEKLSDSGYKIAFSVDNSHVCKNEDYNISRILISNNTTNSQLKAYLTEAWFVYSRILKVLVNTKEKFV